MQTVKSIHWDVLTYRSVLHRLPTLAAKVVSAVDTLVVHTAAPGLDIATLSERV